MKAGLIVTAVGCSALFGLVIRRILMIQRAKKAFRQIAHNSGLDVLPHGYFRVCITGTSGGIGKACKELLSQYGSVSLLSVSRRGVVDIITDLTDDSSVRNFVNTLRDKWYNHTDDPTAGQDIFINNAGIYQSHRPSKVWETNMVAPCFITEVLSELFLQRNIKSRMLRFVQVSSRLEAESKLACNNLRQIATDALENRSTSSQFHYADSKRALTLHTAYMSHKYRSHSSLSYVTVTPGMVNTELGRPSVSSIVWFLTLPIRWLFFRHPIEGAVSVLWAAFDCPSESGVFTADQKIIERISETRDLKAGEVITEIVNEHFNLV
jgi:NAD(P)-dependent dehydrogenase (short-subunit alcohol dehydrogenase family)